MNPQVLKDTLKRIKVENGGITAFGLRFYERLFEKYPQVKPLFTTPPEDQHKKLVSSVAAIVALVQSPDKLMPFLHAMGIRHKAYKTLNSHYPAVGENLLAVMNEHLSKEGQWTDEMQENWSEAMKTVSSVMIEAADNPDKFKDEMAAAGFEPDGFRKDTKKPWELEAISIAYLK